jgi:hypothetical protein
MVVGLAAAIMSTVRDSPSIIGISEMEGWNTGPTANIHMEKL